jgi:hypothetical protein
MRCGRGGGTGSPRSVNRMHAYITRAHTQTHANTHMYSSGTRDRAQIPHRRSDYHPRDITPAGCEQSWRAESQGKPSELVPTCRARSCPHILVPLYVHSCISIQCVRCTQCILTLSLNTNAHTCTCNECDALWLRGVSAAPAAVSCPRSCPRSSPRAVFSPCCRFIEAIASAIGWCVFMCECVRVRASSHFIYVRSRQTERQPDTQKDKYLRVQPLL